MLGYIPDETPEQTRQRLFDYAQDYLNVFEYHNLCDLVHNLNRKNTKPEEINRLMTFFILDKQ